MAQDSLIVRATRISQRPVIDGRLTDEAWRLGVISAQFTQRDPIEYGQPSQKTEVVVLYDDDALYVGARLYDTAPDSIVARLARRDVDAQSDLFGVFLDSYHDHRSGFSFGLNAAGVRYDITWSNDIASDNSWDGVWDGAVSRDREGWCAEFRIPFSQLRFNRQTETIWGINFQRNIQRLHEADYLTFTPKDGAGFVSRFRHLTGLESLTPTRYAELLPYGRAQARYREPVPGDPFHGNAEYRPNFGCDFKFGKGSKLSLNATVNPDFGQVEVDPAVVNLSDVETIYSEKRPFFVEGSSYFDFSQGGTSNVLGFGWSEPSYFYSRRIGRAPRGGLPFYNHADVPEAAHILGAAKLTGKLKGDWNFGSLHALTMREYARLDAGAGTERQEVEPATYYTVTRALKELRGGSQALGGMLTLSQPFFKDDGLKSAINGGAVVGGLDGWMTLDRNGVYKLAGWSEFSNVRGSAERMVAVQRSSAHYFQRPDAAHLQVDSSTTSLSGFAGRLNLNKERGNVFLNAALGTVSPGFDANDLGITKRTDHINGHFCYGYKWTQLTSLTRFVRVLGAAFNSMDYAGNRTGSGLVSSNYFEFLNYWTTDLRLIYNPSAFNSTLTRGGPMTESLPGWDLSIDAATDSRKLWVFSAGTYGHTIARHDWDRGVYAGVEWKPATNLDLLLGPEIYWAQGWNWWVGSQPDLTAASTYGERFIYAEAYQTQIAAKIQLDWTFTPRLSLQLYAVPVINSTDYENFKELNRPSSHSYRTYPARDVQSARDAGGNGIYTIDPDGSGAAPAFSFSDPDFDFRSLRGDVVLRWEYLPGSTVYFVWTHGRTAVGNIGDFNVSRSFAALGKADQDNIFLMKATYWLSF